MNMFNAVTHSVKCADMNVVPADVMAEMGAKKIIAVDVSREKKESYHEYGTELSGLWLLWNSWWPFVQTVSVQGIHIALYFTIFYLMKLASKPLLPPATGESP